MGLQGKLVSCKRCAHGKVCAFRGGDEAIKCSQFDAPVDREALLTLAVELESFYVNGGHDGDELVASRGAIALVVRRIREACGEGM